jgi:hypothetical protein
MLNQFRQSVGALSFGLLAAGLAALVAHIAIDALGDVALVRDAYDGLAHGSRDLAALGLVAGAVTLAMRFVLAALGGTAGRDRLSRALIVPSSPVAFIGGVMLGAVVLLIGMESLDALVATGGLTDLADALGGSALLGLAVAVPVAGLLGWCAWRALRWVAATRDALLRAIGAIFSITVLPVRPSASHLGRVAVPVVRSSTVLRRAAKRGPPLFLST